MIHFLIGLSIGGLLGIFFMSMLQINRTKHDGILRGKDAEKFHAKMEENNRLYAERKNA